MVEESQQATARASALVVSYNRAGRLRQCLEALERSASRELIQILVVDNGSQDGSAQLESDFPNAQFIRLPRNFGLTKALNIGIRSSTGEYVLLLHDDVAVAPEAVKTLWERLDADPDAGAVCPLLVDEEGRPSPQLGELPKPGGSPGVWRTAETRDESLPVEYARGAALMVRSFNLRAIRQLDERYGVFGIDAELCYQIRRAGKKILLLPAAKAVHHLDASEERPPLLAADEAGGYAAFLGKHYGFMAGLRARLGAALKALAGMRLSEMSALISGRKVDGT